MAVPHPLLVAATLAHFAHAAPTGVAQAQLGSPLQPLVATSVFSGHGESCISDTSLRRRFIA